MNFDMNQIEDLKGIEGFNEIILFVEDANDMGSLIKFIRNNGNMYEDRLDALNKLTDILGAERCSYFDSFDDILDYYFINYSDFI